MSLSDVSWRPPRLETERLLLRGWEPTDVEAVFAYASDPDVTPFMAWDQHRSIDDSGTFLDVLVAEHYGGQEFDYCICLKTDPAMAIGGIGSYWRSRPHGTMELGYVLRRSAWGNGFVPEAGRRLIRHAFETTDVARIFAPIFVQNTKSRRAAEKMGLTFEGVLRSGCPASRPALGRGHLLGSAGGGAASVTAHHTSPHTDASVEGDSASATLWPPAVFGSAGALDRRGRAALRSRLNAGVDPRIRV